MTSYTHSARSDKLAIEIQDLKCLDIVLLMHTIKNARGIHLGSLNLHLLSHKAN